MVALSPHMDRLGKQKWDILMRKIRIKPDGEDKMRRMHQRHN